MGTPDFSVPSLRALINVGHRISLVVTQPDRPKGRKRVLTPPPVKEGAVKHGIPVFQPERLRAPEAVEQLRQIKADLIVTAAYGQILPKAILSLPAFGCINVHASLLPQYRGGAPIHRAIINGETKTGITIMYMAEGLDTGDIISQIEIPITGEDTFGAVHDKLSEAGAHLLVKTLPALLNGSAQSTPQNDAEASYAPNIKREDELIYWEHPAMDIYNQIRGLNPWPVAFTLLEGQVFKVWKALHPKHAPSPGSGAASASAKPGTVLQMSDKGIEVLTGNGTLWLTEIQPAGKKAMDAVQFMRGSTIPAGTVLGE
jgi:methionyl-tRNA formyltransferase